MNFRCDINALRAFSIIIVLMYHFEVPLMSGGFVGVDVFFVISGYLMTKIIYDKIGDGSFSIINFYSDRAYRIIPALMLVCTFLLFIGWFFLYPLEYRQLAKEVIAAVFFGSNLLYWIQSGYFDSAAHELLLLHTWSLSVEWQFYLLYPVVIVLFVNAFGIRKSKFLLLILFLLSLLFSGLAVDRSSFYLLPVRAWEMLAGAIVFLYPLNALNVKFHGGQVVGVLLIIFGVGIADEKMLWPGFIALIPVLGACVFIQSQEQNTLLVKNKVIQFLGRSSYSIYLWHWPIVYWLNKFGKLDEIIFVILGVFVSIFLGWLSYITVEKYFLRLKKRHKKLKEKSYNAKSIIFLLPLYFIVFPAYAIYALGGVSYDVRSMNKDDRAVFLKKYKLLHKYGLKSAYLLKCDFYDNENNRARLVIDPSCTKIEKGNKKIVFLWGDSHAQALSYGVRSILPIEYEYAQVATSACFPRITPSSYVAKIDNNCEYSNKFALSEIKRISPEIVVLAQNKYYENTDWVTLAKALYKMGVKRVVLVGPMPQFRPSLPTVVVWRDWNTHNNFISNGLDKSILNSDMFLKNKYENNTYLLYVSLVDELCNADGCRAFIDISQNRNLMLVDSGHLSPKGSLFVGEEILSKIFYKNDI